METKFTIVTEHAAEPAIILEILAEIREAEAKHPTWPKDAVSRAAIVAEEAGEVIREANHIREGCGDRELLWNELVQTAGVCIRMLRIMHDEKTGLPFKIVHERDTYCGPGSPFHNERI